MVLSEIIRFVLPRSQAAGRAFSKLREQVTAGGIAKNQYFGYVLENQGFPIPKQPELMCWYLEWPSFAQRQWSEELKNALTQLAGNEPRTLLYDFVETKPGGVLNALKSNVCQFAIIKLNSSAPRLTPALEQSMHKTFTDCYLAEGFVDGGWAYTLNTNDEEGITFDEDFRELKVGDRRLAYYPLGWESLEAHHAYSRTELFDEEINKLSKYFALGSGAWYVVFEKNK